MMKKSIYILILIGAILACQEESIFPVDPPSPFLVLRCEIGIDSSDIIIEFNETIEPASIRLGKSLIISGANIEVPDGAGFILESPTLIRIPTCDWECLDLCSIVITFKGSDPGGFVLKSSTGKVLDGDLNGKGGGDLVKELELVKCIDDPPLPPTIDTIPPYVLNPPFYVITPIDQDGGDSFEIEIEFSEPILPGSVVIDSTLIVSTISSGLPDHPFWTPFSINRTWVNDSLLKITSHLTIDALCQYQFQNLDVCNFSLELIARDGVTDLDHNELAGEWPDPNVNDYITFFEYSGAEDTVPPYIVSPPHQEEVTINQPWHEQLEITVVFSEPVKEETVDTSGTLVLQGLEYDGGGLQAVTLAVNLDWTNDHTLEITTVKQLFEICEIVFTIQNTCPFILKLQGENDGITDLAGNPLAGFGEGFPATNYESLFVFEWP